MILFVKCECGRGYDESFRGGGSWVCQCGRSVEEPGYSIRPDVIARRERVKKRISTLQKIQQSLRRMCNGEKYGDAVGRFQELAIRHGKIKLATRLSEILESCGCARDVAIETLNKQGWPT